MKRLLLATAAMIALAVAAPLAAAQSTTPTPAPTSVTAPRSDTAQNFATPESLDQHSRDAGMRGTPMSAQDVCAPREISLTSSGARLSHDGRRQLINAADRASACEVRRVVINSPNGRADSTRRLLIDHGVDANLIEVQDSNAGGLQVDMQFAGVATSSDQYAALFSTQQLASNEPSTAQGPTYQPSPSAPPLEEPSTPGET